VPSHTTDTGSWNGSSRSRARAAAARPVPEGSTPYALGRQLESGSTGEVFEATHPFLPGRYVVKVLKPGLAQLRSAVETFRAELTTISSLRHPNIVQILEVGDSQDGRPFVVMERLEGRSLEARLGDGRPLPPEEVASLIKGLAGGLQAAHSRGVFHRELHPGNVFLAEAEGHEHGFPKILNFGIARLRNASGGDAGFGAEEARYMAPEQAQGRAEAIDGRTDQFALAAIAYRLLVGADAFRGADPIAVLYQVVHEPPEPMSAYAHVAPAVEQVVLRGLSKRQAERFDTVIELARALEEAVEGAPVRQEARTPRSWEEGPTPRSWEEESPHPARVRSATPRSSSGLALPGGGVLLDEVRWDGPDEFDDLDRLPRHRGRAVAFLLGFVIVCGAAALWAGWRPPLAWRQSGLWHALHLPHAAQPTLAAPERPPAPKDFPEPASPPPVTGAAAPTPSAPATPGPGELSPSEAAPVAAPAPEPAPAKAPTAAKAPAAAPPAEAKEEEPRPAKERRAQHREPAENMNLRGVVWSDKEQRLVPAGAAPAPTATATPAPTPAPAAAPAPTEPPAAPSLPPRPMAPEDRPLPLSKP
jgi:serine/threonine-protein kinase